MWVKGLWGVKNFQCSLEEIKSELKNQGVMDVKRITIKKGKIIETNTYAMIFNRPSIPEKIKVGYSMEWVEQFIPNPLRCYKCQRYGLHEDNCKGKEVCGKFGQQNPDTILLIVTSWINVPIVVETILFIQDLVRVGDKKRKYWKSNTKTIFLFMKQER